MACDFIALSTSGVQALTPYRPGNTDAAVINDLLMLASNENPLGTGVAAKEAIQQHVARLNDYPDPVGGVLKEALCTRFDLKADQITLGNGSNDVLELVARAFLTADDEAVYSQYGFLVYPIVTQACGAKGIEVPAKGWGHDLAAMAEAVTKRTKVIFIANPNNPTGTWFDTDTFVHFMAQVPEHVVVVLDEAYTEFFPESVTNGVKLCRQYPNLVVTRSFSKAYGLAGLRVGYAVANPQITDLLNRVRQPFNVNALGLVAAAAALADLEHLEKTSQMNRQGMVELEHGFKALGLDWIASKGNFLTVNFGERTLDIFNGLKAFGILVRPLDNYQMPSHLRITVGTPEQNARLLKTLHTLIGD